MPPRFEAIPQRSEGMPQAHNFGTFRMEFKVTSRIQHAKFAKLDDSPEPEIEKEPSLLFIGNIDENCPDGVMKGMLEVIGNVKKWSRIKDSDGKFPPFGFCAFESMTSAAQAILTLNNFKIGRKSLKVRVDEDTSQVFVNFIINERVANRKPRKRMGTELSPNESDLEDITKLRQKLRDFLRIRDPKLVSDNDDDLKNIGVKVLDVPADDKKNSPKSDEKHHSRKRRSRSRSSSKRSKRRKSSEQESRKSRHKDEIDEKGEKHKSRKSRHKDEADEKGEKHKSGKSGHNDEDRKHKKRDRGDESEKSKGENSKRHKDSSSKGAESKLKEKPSKSLSSENSKHHKDSPSKEAEKIESKPKKESCKRSSRENSKRHKDSSKVPEEKIESKSKDHKSPFRVPEKEVESKSVKLEAIEPDDSENHKNPHQVIEEMTPEEDDFEVSSEIGSIIEMMMYMSDKGEAKWAMDAQFNSPYQSVEFDYEEQSESKTVDLQREILPKVNAAEEEFAIKKPEITPQVNIESLTEEERKQIIKKLIESIPTNKEALFKYQVEWNQLNDELIGKAIKPWVSKQIRGYLGNDKPSLVDLICDKVAARIKPTELLDDLTMFLKKDTEIFMIKFWRLIIYQAEAKRVGLSDNVSRSR